MNKYLSVYLDWLEDKIVPNQNPPRPKAGERTIYGVVIGDPGGDGYPHFSRPSYKEVYELKVKRGSRFKLNVGYPATVKTFNSKFMKMTRAWQYFCRDLICLAMPELTVEEASQVFSNLMGGHVCYTNGKGSDTLACYPTGTNLNKGPIMKETIFTQGAVLKIRDNAQVFTMRGGRYFRVSILDMNKLPPPLPPNADISPWVHWATNSRRELTRNADGSLSGREDIVNRFPQGHTETHDYNVPFINAGNGSFDFVPEHRIRLLEPGEPFPSPYVW